MRPGEHFRHRLNLLLLPIAAFYFYGLGALPLLGPDEPRYAQVAREMFARHDWITPTLGAHPWFEKPPLVYWMMIAAYRFIGTTEYAARLGAAVSGLLTAALVFWISSRVVSREVGCSENDNWANYFPFLSTLIFLSSEGVIVFSRAASFDIVVTCTIAVALACFLWADIWKYQSSAPLAGFYVFVGVSLLAKGLVGVAVPCAVIGTYFLFRRELPSRFLLLSLLWGVPLTIACAAIWYAPIIARYGSVFIDQFFIQHHFARFISNKYHHPQPIYFYIIVLMLLALPWTIFLLAALLGCRKWTWSTGTARGRMRVFALSWTAAPVIFFSLSQSKLPAYILPVMPAVALLIADWLLENMRSRANVWAMRLTGLLSITLVFVGVIYAARRGDISWVPMIIVALLVLATSFALVFQSSKGLPVITALAILSVVVCGIGLKYGAPVFARRESVRDLVSMASARGYDALPVVQMYEKERTSEYYCAGRIEYGRDGEPVVLTGMNQLLAAAEQNGGSILVLVPRHYSQELSSFPRVNVEILGTNGHVVLGIARVVPKLESSR